MIYYYLRLIARWILRFIELQLFITFITWPLLLAWGIPLSYASPVGNLIGNPLLSIFLGLSSFIFMTELLAIPNYWLIYALEQLNNLLFSPVISITNSVLIATPTPHSIVLACIPAIALGILHYKKKIRE